jgi:hypothetical protein
LLDITSGLQENVINPDRRRWMANVIGPERAFFYSLDKFLPEEPIFYPVVFLLQNIDNRTSERSKIPRQ